MIKINNNIIVSKKTCDTNKILTFERKVNINKLLQNLQKKDKK